MTTEDKPVRAAYGGVSPHGRHEHDNSRRRLGADDYPGTDDGPATISLLEPAIPAPRTATAPIIEAVRPEPYRTPRPRRASNLLAGGPWPLIAVLAVQAALSLRLVWANTAFQDEALYLWAGHMEWSHWLSGATTPLYPAYFSGAPVLYPPLGALADSVGGLAGARILSLCFMLAATTLLWGTASRLYGRRAAFFAAALWAVLGSTLKLGAFATYDPMSLFLLAVATWCVVHAGSRRDETRWIAAAAAALVVANATKYASALFDPVVVAIAILHARAQGVGRKLAVSRGAALAAYVVAGTILLVMIGGGYYEAGIGQTTLTRAPGTDSPVAVLADSWSWTAPILLAALAGVLISLRAEADGSSSALLAVLAAAAYLVPLEQARIHTLTSLDKHVDFGAWFAAISAGYAAERLLAWLRPRWLSLAATAGCAAALIFPARLGTELSRSFFHWPNAVKFDTTFGRLAAAYPGRFLVETPSIPEYYLRAGKRWQMWSNTRSIVLPTGHSISTHVDAAGSPRIYARFIKRDYFSIVALNFQSTEALDQRIAADLNDNGVYRVVARVPYGPGFYTIWARQRVRAG